MREIKFRAWLKDKKRMVNVVEIDFIGDQIVWLEDDDYMKSQLANYEVFDDIVLMQFTGLKDNNGVDIYGGYIGWDKYNESTGVVMFDEGKFKFVWENIVDDLSEVHSDIEIIGNIHENK